VQVLRRQIPAKIDKRTQTWCMLRKNGHEGDPGVNTKLLETLVTPL
jgi:hypothetical protein